MRRAARRAGAVAAVLCALAGNADAQGLSECARQYYDPEDLLTIDSGCQLAVRIYYLLKSDIGDPAKVRFSPSIARGPTAPRRYTHGEVDRAGGLVIAVCPAGRQAFEADGITPWSGRDQPLVCRAK